MLIEQFTPQEYVASCWYVAEGDCYTDLFHDIIIYPTKNQYNYGEYVAENHGRHRLPSEGFFNSDQLAEPLQDTEGFVYYEPGEKFNIYNLNPGETIYNNDYMFKPVTTPVYVFKYNGETHYLKNISYPSNSNATS